LELVSFKNKGSSLNKSFHSYLFQGIGLLAIPVLIADCILLNLTIKKSFYQSIKDDDYKVVNYDDIEIVNL
jgi:hypothetical protein